MHTHANTCTHMQTHARTWAKRRSSLSSNASVGESYGGGRAAHKGFAQTARDARDMRRGTQEANTQAMTLDCSRALVLSSVLFGMGTTRESRAHLQPQVQQCRHVFEAPRAGAVKQIGLQIQVLQGTISGERGKTLQRIEADIQPLQQRQPGQRLCDSGSRANSSTQNKRQVNPRLKPTTTSPACGQAPTT